MELLSYLMLEFIERYDAKHHIPRPADRPDLTAKQAAVRCLKTGGEMVLLFACGLASAFLFSVAANNFGAESNIRPLFTVARIAAVLISIVEALGVLLAFENSNEPSNRPITQPVARWADHAWLRSAGLAQELITGPSKGELRLGTLPTGYHLVIPASLTSRHIALFGPPGSGKSRFICSFLHDWARSGSVIVFDSRGDLFEHTASRFRRVYRLDLVDPSRSDYWNFVSDCKGNPELAHEVASTILSNSRRAGGAARSKDWIETEIKTLTAILLHLPHIVDQPTPAMICQFIALRSIDPLGGETEPELTKEMNGSPDPNAVQYWSTFANASRSQQGEILSDLVSRCRAFTKPEVQAVTSKLASPGSVPRYAIDLELLRQPGTAVYVHIHEHCVERYAAFVNTFLGLAVNSLGKASSAATDCGALLVFDEPAALEIPNLDMVLTLARTTNTAAVLALSNLGQIYEQRAPRLADVILRSINTKVFLPGLDRRTTDFAANLFAVNATTGDRRNDRGKRKNKALNRQEVELASTYAKEISGLAYNRAIALIGSALPVKLLHPPDPTVVSTRTRAGHKGMPYVVDFPSTKLPPSRS
jgi:type IV secretory pathway TraG/TraD family ATPase VirD4